MVLAAYNKLHFQSTLNLYIFHAQLTQSLGFRYHFGLQGWRQKWNKGQCLSQAVMGSTVINELNIKQINKFK